MVGPLISMCSQTLGYQLAHPFWRGRYLDGWKGYLVRTRSHRSLCSKGIYVLTKKDSWMRAWERVGVNMYYKCIPKIGCIETKTCTRCHLNNHMTALYTRLPTMHLKPIVEKNGTAAHSVAAVINGVHWETHEQLSILEPSQPTGFLLCNVRATKKYYSDQIIRNARATSGS